MATYTYNPALCSDNAINQMRMELGDTAVEQSELSAALCDEEYQAMIIANSNSWRRAKIACLRAILMRMSYEVDTSVDGLSYALSQRVARWKELYEQLSKENSTAVPLANAGALSPPNGEYYFYNDMQSNPRK